MSQIGYGYNYMGQTETPRREEWSVSSFPGVVVPLHNVALTFIQDSRYVWGSCLPAGLLVCVRTIRRGIHVSTSEHLNGLCAVVPVSDAHLGATASETVSLGESVH